MYEANNIADWFLLSVDRESGDSITHLKLQKLVYYAQAWALALLGTPLFEEDMQAWTHGPVAPSIFHRFKGSGWESLPPPSSKEGEVSFNDSESELLEIVLGSYGQYSAKHLEKLTHSEDPWITARGALPLEAKSSVVISKSSMGGFYKEKYESINV